MWRDQLEAKLKPHLSEGAVNAACSLMSAFHTTEEIMAGRVTPDVRQAAAQMLVDLTVGLASNPWWQRHAGVVLPVFAVAVNAWLDSGEYARRSGGSDLSNPDTIRAVYVRSTMVEVVSAVSIADLGFARAREVSVQLRDAVTSLER